MPLPLSSTNPGKIEIFINHIKFISSFSTQLYQLTSFSSKDNNRRRESGHIKLSRGLSVGGGVLKYLTCCQKKDKKPTCEIKCKPYNGKYRKWALKIDCMSKVLFPVSYFTVVVFIPVFMYWIIDCFEFKRLCYI